MTAAGSVFDAASKPRILETVVVEGKDDQSAVLAAADANVIWTNGYGITQKTLDLISAAAERTGIVIFTDPDHAGRQIRERLTKLFPGAKQAYLTQSQAEKDGDIGIENASPEDILKALRAARCVIKGAQYSTDGSCDPEGGIADDRSSDPFDAVTADDLVDLGLAGCEGSSEKRALAGAKLGIGTANTKTFLKRLSFMGIGLKELEAACR